MTEALWSRFETLAGSAKSEDLFGDLDGCWSRGISLDVVSAIAWLIERAAGPDAEEGLVGIHLPRDRRYLATLFAAWMTGRPVLPLSTGWPRKHLEHVLGHAEAAIVVAADSADASDCGTGVTVRLPDVANVTALAQPPADVLPVWRARRARQDLLYIIYTSGSTGGQKGVCISRAAFEAYVGWAARHWAARRYRALLITAELTFDLFLGDVAFALAHDVEMHLSPQPGNIHAHAYLLQARHVDVFYSVPSTLAHVFRLIGTRHDVKADRLQLVVSGGDVLSPHLIEAVSRLAPQAEFHNVYGPTELTINCLAIRVDTLRDHVRALNLVPIGRPFAHLKARLADEQPGEHPGWVTGELLVGGVQAMSGYFRDPLRTAAAFVAIDGRSYYRTGDLVARDPAGLHYFLGRTDSLIKIDGYRVNPAIVDNLLLDQPGVVECKTVPVMREGRPAGLWTFVVLQGDIDPDALGRVCAEHLPRHCRPDRILPVAELPLGSSGKYDAGSLARRARDGARGGRGDGDPGRP